MARGRKITNRSNYFSPRHHGTLVLLAKQVIDYFGEKNGGERWFRDNLDINELINIGWFRQARYWENIEKHMKDTKREMFKWAFKERTRKTVSIGDVEEEMVYLTKNLRKTKK
jgi:hypothetical protein